MFFIFISCRNCGCHGSHFEKLKWHFLQKYWLDFHAFFFLSKLIEYVVFIPFPFNFFNKNEPPHDKTNKITCAPREDSDHLGIRPVWSVSSLCAQWVAKDPKLSSADSKDFDRTGRMPKFDLRWAHMLFVGFVMRWLKCSWRYCITFVDFSVLKYGNKTKLRADVLFCVLRRSKFKMTTVVQRNYSNDNV